MPLPPRLPSEGSEGIAGIAGTAGMELNSSVVRRLSRLNDSMMKLL
jgi:hypothetical protein